MDETKVIAALDAAFQAAMSQLFSVLVNGMIDGKVGLAADAFEKGLGVHLRAYKLARDEIETAFKG